MEKNISVYKNEDLVLPILWLGKESQISYNINLEDSNAKVTVLALLLGKKSNKLNLKINLIHKKPQTDSKIIIKSILNNKASICFEGLIKIEPKAKKSSASLTAHVLLLSDQAKSTIIPSLEISENDIKAGHATTISPLNKIELFYLMSRGLTKKDAETLIIQGFTSSILKEFPKNITEQAKKILNTFTS